MIARPAANPASHLRVFVMSVLHDTGKGVLLQRFGEDRRIPCRQIRRLHALHVSAAAEGRRLVRTDEADVARTLDALLEPGGPQAPADRHPTKPLADQILARPMRR